ncbi:LOW QUALITY PROTEIN: hypothetical protein CVT25_013657 [Psilocybe cyanescens]|uniref:Uncharacterized protein n=1 Tax=Psilocybe cyanescens TaxID=93625 RepID=A0A409WTM4_PSICY|nr:LOW QUALITY PROTEIN: hypothetical protein CVT25_013657 [Psilocybe cyanescens]
MRQNRYFFHLSDGLIRRNKTMNQDYTFCQRGYDHWPDDGPDASPTAPDVMYIIEAYTPKDLIKLEQAVPRMENIRTFHITCPFYPPNSFLRAIVRCPSIKDMRMIDTPFRKGLAPNSLPSIATFKLECLSFTPVGETNRVGEGPVERRYSNMGYYSRPHSKKYCTDGGVPEALKGSEAELAFTPFAHSRANFEMVLNNLDTTGNGKCLKTFRIMVEDGLDSTHFERLGQICPLLENLEVEICGYCDGEAGCTLDGNYLTEVLASLNFTPIQTDHGDAFDKYEYIQRLRIGIPFEGFDEGDPKTDPGSFLRADRRKCGFYLASRLHTLCQVAGGYRYEDRWLDFDIQRHWDGSIVLHELGQSWYPFPEVWTTVSLNE